LKDEKETVLLFLRFDGCCFVVTIIKIHTHTHRPKQIFRERERERENERDSVWERGGMKKHQEEEEEEKDGVRPMAEEEGTVGSSLTMERVAAAKQFIENHYKAQMKHIQERKERYRFGFSSICFLLILIFPFPFLVC
jgi:predicted TIM-barrel fold metal-dependent hydrolase